MRMRTLEEQLTQYAAYHREPRNVVTHFVGIPLIVLAAFALLARPAWHGVTPALVLAVASSFFYLRLDRRYGLVMLAVVAVCLWVGQRIAALPTGAWLAWGLGLFVVGWVFQLVGHVYEGKKPAFVDDIVGLLVGPLFVAAEVGFLLGLRRDVQHVIEESVGPLRVRVRTAAIR